MRSIYFNFRITVATRIVHHKEFIPMMCKVLTQKVEKTLCGGATGTAELLESLVLKKMYTDEP